MSMCHNTNKIKFDLEVNNLASKSSCIVIDVLVLLKLTIVPAKDPGLSPRMFDRIGRT